MESKSHLKYWLLTFLLILIILFFSLLPQPFNTIGLEKTNIDFNPLHILAYFALSWSLSYALSFSKNKALKTHSYAYTIVLCFLFGALIEIAQYFIPERYFSLIDMEGYNLSGILLAQLIRYLIKRIKK